MNGAAPVSPSSSRFNCNRADMEARKASARPPVVAPVIIPNPRSVSGMPDPMAQNPTRGFAWAFPDKAEPDFDDNRGSSESSMDRSLPSRQNSYAASINSSILTADSHLPPGQRRLDDVGGKSLFGNCACWACVF